MPQAIDARAPRRYALIAGVSYVAIFVLAIAANFFVLEALIVRNDPAATAANLIAGEGRFRLAVAAFVVVLILDVILSWAFYELMRPTDAALSLLAAMFRLVYTASQVGVLLLLVHALRISHEAPGFGPQLQEAMGYFFLRAHAGGFTLTLIFFGVHLLLLGWLIVRSTYLPTLVGVLVALAGAGYVFDGMLWIVVSDYAALPGFVPLLVLLPALIGEGALWIWLLFAGVRTEAWLLEAAAAARSGS